MDKANDMQMRQANSDDHKLIQALYVAAFPEFESETIASVAVNLLSERTHPETFCLVAESDGLIVGHIAFSPVSDPDADGFLGYILAPLAVHPNFQKRHIGTELIELGVAQLSKLEVDIVFVYGDPNFYGRFGFISDQTLDYVPPHQLQFPFGWQAKTLADPDSFASSGKLTCVPSLNRADIW